MIVVNKKFNTMSSNQSNKKKKPATQWRRLGTSDARQLVVQGHSRRSHLQSLQTDVVEVFERFVRVGNPYFDDFL
jgi:hypothetical protein